MSCRICRKWDCTESFHSLEEQDEYVEIDGKLVRKDREDKEDEQE